MTATKMAMTTMTMTGQSLTTQRTSSSANATFKSVAKGMRSSIVACVEQENVQLDQGRALRLHDERAGVLRGVPAGGGAANVLRAARAANAAALARAGAGRLRVHDEGVAADHAPRPFSVGATRAMAT